VPGDNGETHSTQFYPPSSVYCLTPVSEAAARIVAKTARPEPVTRWELPEPRRVEPREGDEDEEDEERVSARRGYEFNGEGKGNDDDF
jgi:hypothetical protein